MDGNTFNTLRAANRARQAEWDKDARITLSYRLNELAGETGEACNVGKKIERERLGIAGSRDTIEHLAEELADVVICADLVAMGEGVDLEAAVVNKFNATSEKVGLDTRLSQAVENKPNDERALWVSRVMEIREECEGAGVWNPCSGCQESVDGYVSQTDYPYSAAFGCQPGGGCSECGGLGVKWDTTDYDEMARSIMSDMVEEEAVLDAARTAYRACHSAWSCGEPHHRVKAMVDAVDALGVALGEPGARPPASSASVTAADDPREPA